MAEWERRGNVLVVYDNAIHNKGNVDPIALWRYLDQDLLAGLLSPVRRGTHDFWVIHAYPQGETSSVYFPWNQPADPAIPGSRPFHGIVRMAASLGSLDRTQVTEYMQTFAQEMAHHWLAPGGLRVPQGPFDGPREFVREAAAGRFTSPLSIYGRGGNHWATFLQADASPIDGMAWQEDAVVWDGFTREREETRLRRYLQRTDKPPVPFTTPGMPGTSCVFSYNDLELYLMGAIDAAEAYPATQGGFDSLVPHWMQGPNLHAGLALVFGSNDIVLFGFHRGFEALGLWRTDSLRGRPTGLDGVHTPWRNDERMFLRVVRRGSRWSFQAFPDNAAAGCANTVRAAFGLRPALAADPLADPDTAPEVDDGPWIGWRTVATLDEPRTPIAIGYMATTWGVSPILSLSVRPLFVQDGTQRREVSQPGETVMDLDAAVLRDDAFTLHLPEPRFAVVAQPDGFQVRIAPTLVKEDGQPDGIGSARHTANEDRAPKLLARAPAGDFVAAGSVRLERTLMEPEAAGEAIGMRLWAYRHRFAVRDLQLPPDAEARRREESRQRTAFIVVAPDRSLLGQLPPLGVPPQVPDAVTADADRIRVACASYFSAATRGRRSLETGL